MEIATVTEKGLGMVCERYGNANVLLSSSVRMQRRETTLSLRRNVTENAVKEIRLLIDSSTLLLSYSETRAKKETKE